MRNFVIFLALFAGIFAFAGESSQEKAELSPAAGKFGPGMAVTAFSEEDGFQMSDRALKNLGVTFEYLKQGDQWTVPKSALVYIKQSTGVYRLYDKWITLVLVNVVEKNGFQALIRSVDLQEGDGIAVTGANFLRMTEADLYSKTVDSCVH